MNQKFYICIDLKSFYASAECVERGLDPLDTNLTVADESRTDKTICLAVSPSLKACGIPGRPRLFELKQKVNEVNALRMRSAPRRNFSGESYSAKELKAHPEYKLSYIVAPPRMSLYMNKSAEIYEIYLKYISPDDIHIYSVDEVFIDITGYLDTYKLPPVALAEKLIESVYTQTGITATAGIGTNLYLAKIAMDIVAKHAEPNKNGARIAELNERTYREQLWAHRPLTDFWRVGKGYAKKLEARGIFTMGDVARCSLANEEMLYRLFGVNAELLIDHAWGVEPCTMADIKAYCPEKHGISTSQVLSEPYTKEDGLLIVKEMAENVALDLHSKGFCTDHLTLTIGYDAENLRNEKLKNSYSGQISLDYYGRAVPEHAHGSITLDKKTSSITMITLALCRIYHEKVDDRLLIRRVNITADDICTEEEAKEEIHYQQLDLFSINKTTPQQLEAKKKSEEKEKKLSDAVLSVKGKFGKNAVIRGLSLLDKATARDRNSQIGGHKSGEVPSAKKDNSDV